MDILKEILEKKLRVIKAQNRYIHWLQFFILKRQIPFEEGEEEQEIKLQNGINVAIKEGQIKILK